MLDDASKEIDKGLILDPEQQAFVVFHTTSKEFSIILDSWSFDGVIITINFEEIIIRILYILI